MELSRSSRAKGAIWGATVGDALGGPVQFMEPGTFKPISCLEYITPFEQPAGSYSDDGATTLALAQTFIDARGSYDHLSSIRLLLDWLFNGHFSTAAYAWDVGMSTRRSLTIWRGEMWQDAQWRPDAAASRALEGAQENVIRALSAEDCSGNGSLMRISPVGVVLNQDLPAARAAARAQSQVTHPAKACVEACELYTELVCRIMQGEDKPRLAAAVCGFELSHPTLRERLSSYKSLKDWETVADGSITSSGWVIDTIEVALWAFFKYTTWKEGALAVVNLGGDSDTAGAVYGALAGAFYGFEAIPSDWVRGMQKPELIEQVASGVARLVSESDERIV